LTRRICKKGDNLMSLMLYGFNVVLKKEALDRVINGGSASFIKRVMEPCHGAISVTSDDYLVAVRFTVPYLLDILVKNLLRHNLTMSADGKFADFAIVHAEHGLSMPCDWLEYDCSGTRAVVWLKGKPRDPACFVAEDPDVESLDRNALGDSEALSESFWLTQIGHGFVLTREDGYNEWLDFNTGRVIVNFLPNASSTIQ
jgi:hypothetical protein